MDLKGVRIGFLVYPHCVASESWLLNVCQAWWERAGAEVVYWPKKRGAPANVDLWVQHYDTTVVQREYVKQVRQLPNVINRRLLDIRKSTVSSQVIVSVDDPWSGEVLVKSEYNYGGLPEIWQDEYLEGRSRKQMLGRWRRPRGVVAPANPYLDYQLYPQLNEVPPEVFADPDRVVERFLPQREGDLYVVNMAYILGDRSKTLKITSKQPVVKWGNRESWEFTETPAEVLKQAEIYGLDFGKLDFTVVDGEPVIFDVNKTPGLGGATVAEEFDDWGDLAQGVLKFL